MNIFGKITSIFIKNKQLSILLLLAILMWGLISFWIMPKQYNPDIIAPAFMIRVDFPNATVDEVYHLVTQPMENVLNEIPGVENIYSKSYHGGKSVVVAEFFVGEDLEKSMITLRQRISSRFNSAPLGINQPCISSIDPDDLPIKTLVLYSDHLNAIDLRKRAYRLKEDLQLVNGTSVIDVVGGRKREIRIVLNPKKLQASKTSLNEIQDVLSKTSLLKDLGLIKATDNYYVVETQEQARTLKAIKEIVIISNFERHLKIKDIADVIETEEEYDHFVSYHKNKLVKKQSVFLSIAKLKGSNIIDVSKNIDQRIDFLKNRKNYLKDVQVEVVRDKGRVAKKEIDGLVINLIQAIAIVFIVLLGFLNHRAAIIVATSIPITLLTVLALGNLFGYTLNRITLFALILSLGLLVDSATVVTENIVRLKKEQPLLPKKQLIPQAISEVGMGLFLSTLTTVLAFIPLLFVTGMMGPYMGPIPFFVSTALIVSLIYAYSLNPWMAYIFCKEDVNSTLKSKCGFICQLINHAMHNYQKLLIKLLSKQKSRRIFLFFSFGILFIVLTFPVFQWLRFRMLPKADREQVYVYLDLPRGVSLEKSKKLADEAIQLLLNEQQVKSIQSFVAVPPVLDFNGLFRNASERNQTNQITLKLNLIHSDKRAEKSEDIAFRLRQILKKQFSTKKNVKIIIVEDPPGPPVKATFLIKVKSQNLKLLYDVAKNIEQKTLNIQGVKDVGISFQEQHDKYVIYIDKEAVAKAKINVDSVTKELETIFSSRIIGVYHGDNNYEQEYVVLRLDRNYRDQIKDLSQIYISNDLGNYVALSRFIKIEEQDQEDIIINDNREKVVYISGEMGQRSATYAAIDMLKVLSQFGMPGHETDLESLSLLKAKYLVDKEDELSIEVHGEWDLTIKVFRDLGLAMIVAIVLIYLVLVAQFQSFMIPFLIMITIPLAMIGVIPGFAVLFLLNRTYFSATSMIGVIALAGIVVNNAIILMEHIKQITSKHSNLKDTLIDAGLTRMRPIMLTSLTTVLGSLVIASDPVWSGLAWSIIFGLSLSAALTLVAFPVLIAEFLGDKWFVSLKNPEPK
ncbi:MAG: efflux RND transporter permease subunit [Candidatus Omnitrophica bacterium]|nr:efflux RND transporter permease subunit [Candidatus Omnitrophota bacterium]